MKILTDFHKTVETGLDPRLVGTPKRRTSIIFIFTNWSMYLVRILNNFCVFSPGLPMHKITAAYCDRCCIGNKLEQLELVLCVFFY